MDVSINTPALGGALVCEISRREIDQNKQKLCLTRVSNG